MISIPFIMSTSFARLEERTLSNFWDASIALRKRSVCFPNCAAFESLFNQRCFYTAEILNVIIIITGQRFSNWHVNEDIWEWTVPFWAIWLPKWSMIFSIIPCSVPHLCKWIRFSKRWFIRTAHNPRIFPIFVFCLSMISNSIAIWTYFVIIGVFENRSWDL